MLFRAMVLAGGIAGAAGFSQFPEYSQQYTQRLAGAVDELARVVKAFDADAAGLDLTREAALADMAVAGGMAEARAQSMRRVFDRYEKISNDLSALRAKAPVVQAMQLWRMTDLDVARQAWRDFRPAVPLTMEGIGFGTAGFLIGAGLIGAMRAILGRYTRKRRATV